MSVPRFSPQGAKSRQFGDICTKWSTAFILLTPLAWLIGLHVFDTSRILLIVAVILFSIYKPNTLSIKLRWLSIGAKYYLAGFIFLSLINPGFRANLGQLGLDTAIFSQCIDALAKFGRSSTSLLSSEGWTPFFGHHLGLIFYLPSWLTYTGISPWMAGFLVNTCSLIFCLTGLRLIAIRQGSHRGLSWIIIALFLMLPTLRHGLFWSFHDEVMTLGFWTFAWYFWQRRSYWWMSLFLVLAMTAKESLYVVAATFGVLLILDGGEFRRRMRFNRQAYFGLFFIFFGASAFLTYVYGHQLFFEKPYDHLSKLSSWTKLFNFSELSEKLLYTTYLVLPFLVFFRRQDIRRIPQLLPFLCILSFAFVSSFAEMWKLNNYYGILPSLFLMLFLLSGDEHEKRFTKARISIYIALCFSFTSTKPATPIWQFIKTPESQLALQQTIVSPDINRSTDILSSESAYLSFLDYPVKKKDALNARSKLRAYLILDQLKPEEFSEVIRYYKPCPILSEGRFQGYCIATRP